MHQQLFFLKGMLKVNVSMQMFRFSKNDFKSGRHYQSAKKLKEKVKHLEGRSTSISGFIFEKKNESGRIRRVGN